jgi:hypothetical protein
MNLRVRRPTAELLEHLSGTQPRRRPPPQVVPVAAPSVVGGIGHEARPAGVQVHGANELQEVAVLLAARFGHRDHSFRHRDQVFRDRDHDGVAVTWAAACAESFGVG